MNIQEEMVVIIHIDGKGIINSQTLNLQESGNI